MHLLFLRDLRLLIHFSDAFQTQRFSASVTPALLGVNTDQALCAPCGGKEGDPSEEPTVHGPQPLRSTAPALPSSPRPSFRAFWSTKGSHWQREVKGKGVGISRYWVPDLTAVIEQF